MEEEGGQRGEATTSILGSYSPRDWLHWCVAPVPEDPSSRWLPMVQVALWGRQQVREREGSPGQDEGSIRKATEKLPPHRKWHWLGGAP